MILLLYFLTEIKGALSLTTTETVGVAIGALAFIIICVVLFWCCCHVHPGFRQEMDREVKEEVKIVQTPYSVPALPAPASNCCGCQNTYK